LNLRRKRKKTLIWLKPTKSVSLAWEILSSFCWLPADWHLLGVGLFSCWWVFVCVDFGRKSVCVWLYWIWFDVYEGTFFCVFNVQWKSRIFD
jgi:hypothetical protein